VIRIVKIHTVVTNANVIVGSSILKANVQVCTLTFMSSGKYPISQFRLIADKEVTLHIYYVLTSVISILLLLLNSLFGSVDISFSSKIYAYYHIYWSINVLSILQ